MKIKTYPGYIYTFYCSSCKHYKAKSINDDKCSCGCAPSVRRQKETKEMRMSFNKQLKEMGY